MKFETWKQYSRLICDGGRLHKADIPLETKHLIIFSNDHHVSNLRSRQIHCEHSGRNRMFSMLRHKYTVHVKTCTLYHLFRRQRY